MPPVIVAVVAAAAGYAASAALVAAGVLVAGSFAAAVVTAVVGAIVAYGMSAMLGLNKVPKLPNMAQDRKHMTRAPVTPRQVIYGRARVSGALVYAASSGDKQQYLHLVVVLAGHPCQEIGTIWLNDKPIEPGEIDADGMVLSGTFDDVVRIKRYLGTQTAADADLVAEAPNGEWTADHRLLRCTYLYVRLEFDADVFQAGIPNVSAEVRGKNDITDPRSGTAGWSNNPALCVLDYLSSEIGLDCANDELDLPFFIAAANVCDEAVELNDAGTLVQKRYELDCAFSLDRPPLEVVEDMLTACAGTLVYVQGQYRLHAGAYSSPTDTLTESDLAGPVELVTKPPRRERFNCVRGTFVSPEHAWQPTEFPSWEDADLIAEDGEKIWQDVEFPGTLDPTRAQRLARMLLRRARESLTLKAPVRYAGIRYSVWQMLAVTLPDFGWVAKPFRVMAFSFDPPSGLITLTLREESAASYAWLYDDAYAQEPAPDTTLIDPLTIPAPTGLTLVASTGLAADGTIQPALLATWTAAAHAFVSGHEVQWRAADAEDWNSAVVPEGVNRLLIQPVLVGQDYDVRVRAITGIARGPWSSTGQAAGAPDSTAPGAPTGVTATGGIRQVALRWTNPAAVDLARVDVYEAAGTDPEVKVGESASDFFVRSGLQPNETRSYRLRAVDRSGNQSGYTAAVTATTSLLLASDLQDAILDTAKFAAGIQPIGIVDEVPAAKGNNPDYILNQTDGKTYRWNGSAYVPAVAELDPNTVITEEMLDPAARPPARVSVLPDTGNYLDRLVYLTAVDGDFQAERLYRWTSDSITTGKDHWIPATADPGVLAAENFPSNLRPIEVVSALPETNNFLGRTVLLETDQKTYRWTSDSVTSGTTYWSASIAAADVSGALAAANFPQNLRPIELVSALPETNNFQGRTVRLTTNNKIYTWTHASQTSGATYWSTSVAASDVSGALAASNFPETLRPIERVSALPETSNFQGRTVRLTTDNKVYTWTHASQTSGTTYWSKAVDGADLIAASVTANAVAAGTISAEHIAAEAVTASKVVIGDTTNMYPDPNMMDPDFYTGTGTYNFITTAVATSGTRRIEMAADTVTQTVTTDWFEVSPSTDYLAEIAAWIPTGLTGAGTLELEWGSLTGTVTPISPRVLVRSAVNNNSGNRFNVAVSTPSDARRARFIATRSGGGDGVFTFARPELRRRANGSLIVDGAITAGKIAAEAVTAEKVQAGAISTAHLAAESVTATKLVLSDTTNVYPDPNMMDSAFYSGTTGGVAVGQSSTTYQIGGTTLAQSGTRRLVINANAAETVVTTGWFDVAASTDYLIEISAYRLGGTAATCSVDLEWGSLGSTGAVTPLTPKATIKSASEDRTSANRIAVAFASPSTARRARLNFTRAGGGDAIISIGKPELRRRSNASLIVNGSIIADKIASGAIQTGHLGAGVVTASKVVIGDTTNMLPDEEFLDAGWTSGVTEYFDTAAPHDTAFPAKRALRYIKPSHVVASGSSFVANNGYPNEMRVPVTPGEQLFFSCYMQSEATANGTAQLLLRWEYQDGSIVETTAINPTLPILTPTRYTFSYTVPANARKVFYRWRRGATVSTGQTVVGWVDLGAARLVRKAAGELIVDGAITATKLAAEAVEADKIKAGAITAAKISGGAVTAEKLSVGSGNVIWNSCCAGDTGGWAADSAPTTLGYWAVGSEWRLRGYGTGHITRTGTIASGSYAWADWVGDGEHIPVAPGRRYEAQALLGAHRCVGYMELHFLNNAGATVGASSSTQATEATPGGVIETGYARVSILATAPSGAVRAVLRIVLAGNGGSNPYVMFTKVGFGETVPNATEVSTWQPGGVTSISGGSILTSSVTSRQINTQQLFADQAVFNNLKAGIASFGGLSASEIAAGQINATHLAATTLITSSAQIGNGVITNAKIGNLEVDTIKIADGSISAVSVATWVPGTQPAPQTWVTLAQLVVGDSTWTGRYLITATLYCDAPHLQYSFSGTTEYLPTMVSMELLSNATLLSRTSFISPDRVGPYVPVYTNGVLVSQDAVTLSAGQFVTYSVRGRRDIQFTGGSGSPPQVLKVLISAAQLKR